MADSNLTSPAAEPTPFKVDADGVEMRGADEGRPYPLMINQAASDADILAIARARLERFTFDLTMLAGSQPDEVTDLSGFAWNLKARVQEVLSLVVFVNQRLYRADEEANHGPGLIPRKRGLVTVIGKPAQPPNGPG